MTAWAVSSHTISKRATVNYNAGPYVLSFAAVSDEKAALLRKLLGNLLSNLQPVLQDLEAPTTSPAYDTFFKTAANKPFLTKLFKNIITGAPVYAPPSTPQWWQPYSPTGSPIIMVISQRGQAHGKLGDFVWGTLVMICPFFFDARPPQVYGDIPPLSINGQPASTCLTVNAVTQRFAAGTPRLYYHQATGFRLTQYRMWILLEELAHLYSNTARNERGIDKYNVNDCVKLSAKDSLANGPSYSYYAASVAGKCTEYPQPKNKGPDRDILSYDDYDASESSIEASAINVPVADLVFDSSPPVLLDAGAA
ncbi:MAG: hypothetical protein Q9168_003411 [Polycauliona sp. 1 TL-2023]